MFLNKRCTVLSTQAIRGGYMTLDWLLVTISRDEPLVIRCPVDGEMQDIICESKDKIPEAILNKYKNSIVSRVMLRDFTDSHIDFLKNGLAICIVIYR